MKKKLLIISNNVLNQTDNNGKTILSFVDAINPENVRQLYFSGDQPCIESYNYYQLSDVDILKGFFNSHKRGRIIKQINQINLRNNEHFSFRIPRNALTLFIRDLFWWGRWKSSELEQWLKEFNPSAVFFVAGDTIFSYRICEYIVKKYKARLTVYVTDDYIMPRRYANWLSEIRRKKISKYLLRILRLSSCFYTISESMRRVYLSVLGFDSKTIANFSDDLFIPSVEEKSDTMKLIYAGSLYYKRDFVLYRIAQVIDKFNQTCTRKALLTIYSSNIPDEKIFKEVIMSGTFQYGGKLNYQELVRKLNESDILVFVESFNEQEKEKTRYSLSTKIPEYLSLGKPILAVGPESIASIDYLKDVGYIITEITELEDKVFELLSNDALKKELGILARKKYIANHNKDKLQLQFVNDVFGNENRFEIY